MNQNTIGRPNDGIELCGPRPPVLPGKESRKSKVCIQLFNKSLMINIKCLK